MNEPIVCPETTEAQDIMDEFRKRQFYFCIVVDEYGSLEGIVTLHDLMENIIGEMPEENLPQVGAYFDYLGYRIEIVDIDHHRIDKILISKMVQEESANEEEE